MHGMQLHFLSVFPTTELEYRAQLREVRKSHFVKLLRRISGHCKESLPYLFR